MCGLDDGLGAHGLGDLGVDRVGGQVRRLVEGTNAACVRPSGVVDGPDVAPAAAYRLALDELWARHVPVAAERDRPARERSVLEGGSEGERLESRARLAPALRGEVVGSLSRFEVLTEFETRCHHLDGPCSVVDHRQGTGGAVDVPEPRPEDPIRLLLEGVVDRHGDLEAAASLAGFVRRRAAEESLLALGVCRTEAVFRIPEDLLAGGDDHLWRQFFEVLMWRRFQRLALGDAGLGRCDELVVGHLVDHRVASCEHHVRVVAHVVEGRVPDGDDHGCGFCDRQFVEFLAEVLLGGRLDAVRVLPEELGVHVELEDLVLRVAPLELCGHDGLADLALDGALVGQEVLLDDLLGDRGAAGEVAGLHVEDGGPSDRLEVDAPVLVEVAVLCGDDRPLDEIGDVLERSRLAVAFRELAEKDPVGRVELGEPPDGRELQEIVVRVADVGRFEIFDRSERCVGLQESEQPGERRREDDDDADERKGGQTAAAPFPALREMNARIHGLRVSDVEGSVKVPGGSIGRIRSGC